MQKFPCYTQRRRISIRKLFAHDAHSDLYIAYGLPDDKDYQEIQQKQKTRMTGQNPRDIMMFMELTTNISVLLAKGRVQYGSEGIGYWLLVSNQLRLKSITSTLHEEKAQIIRIPIIYTTFYNINDFSYFFI